MRITPKLLARLYSAFDTNPDAVLALRLDDATAWRVADGTLTLTGPQEGQTATFALHEHSLASLAAAVAALGWVALNGGASPEEAGRSALALLDGQGSGPGPVLAYTNPVWAYAEAMAFELAALTESVEAAPAQLAVPTAEGYWLDEIGRLYGIPREPGEGDAAYRVRFVEEVLRPKSNNIAMEAVLERITGGPVTVRDVTIYRDPVPAYDGTIVHDGTYQHNATAQPVYGLFDVECTYDLLGSTDADAFYQAMVTLIGRLRAAGTHLRSLTVTAGTLTDAVPDSTADAGFDLSVGVDLEDAPAAPSDVSQQMVLDMAGALVDPADPPTDGGDLALSYTHTFDGSWTFGGSRPFASGETVTDAL